MVVNTIKPKSTYMGYEYVDLGLPSGLLWATANVGASSVTDFGNLYMWKAGDVTYEEAYNDLGIQSNDALNEWEGSNTDTATVVMGGNWRMPTFQEQAELRDNSTVQYVQNYNNSGVRGAVVTGPNGNTIFFPGAGMARYGSVDNNGQAQVWTSTAYQSNKAYDCTFASNGTSWSLQQDRVVGKNVRGVTNTTDGEQIIDKVIYNNAEVDAVYIGSQNIYQKQNLNNE